MVGFGNADLVSTLPDASSLYESFVHGVKLSGDSPFLGTRAVINGSPGPFVWQTYNEVYKRVKNLA
jgi:long-chain acyl-CoA synthetase